MVFWLVAAPIVGAAIGWIVGYFWPLTPTPTPKPITTDQKGTA